MADYLADMYVAMENAEKAKKKALTEQAALNQLKSYVTQTVQTNTTNPTPHQSAKSPNLHELGSFLDGIQGFKSNAGPKCYKHDLNEVTFNGYCVTGRCIKCSEMVDIKTLPNSITALRAKALIEKWLTTKRLRGHDVDTLPEIVAEIKLLKAMLEVDMDEIELAKDRLDIIECDILSLLNEDMVDLQDDEGLVTQR